MFRAISIIMPPATTDTPIFLNLTEIRIISIRGISFMFEIDKKSRPFLKKISFIIMATNTPRGIYFIKRSNSSELALLPRILKGRNLMANIKIKDTPIMPSFSILAFI